MKKVAAIVVMFVFLFVSGIVIAEASCGTCGKGDSAFECAAKCIRSWDKGCMGMGKKGEATEKAPAPALTDEELQKQRECVGMGMRGRIK
ncbi:MAG: hypothetical protein PHI59_01160 [Candidatus Omnitrophica bacterium]|nr:hypothetical protein [Candidatus Omnitrophota bacterium]